MEELYEEIPEDVYHWLDGFKGLEEEMGYPAKLNGEYGFCVDEEYWHTSQTNEVCKEWIEENPEKTREKVLKQLKQTASLLEKLETNISVFVGEETAPFKAHDLMIFIPFGTTNKRYEEIMDSYDYAARRSFRKKTQAN